MGRLFSLDSAASIRAFLESVCDELPALRGFHRLTYCTNDVRAHVSYREIKAHTLCPRTLSRVKNPRNRQDGPLLVRGGEEGNLAYSIVGENATRVPTSRGDAGDDQASPRLLGIVHPVQERDLEVLADPVLWLSAGGPTE